MTHELSTYDRWNGGFVSRGRQYLAAGHSARTRLVIAKVDKTAHFDCPRRGHLRAAMEFVTISSVGNFEGLSQNIFPTSQGTVLQGTADVSDWIASLDNVDISSSTNDDGGSSSASSSYYVDPRITAATERAEELAKTDPSIMVYDQVLTASDKQMLGQLQGTGHWQSNGPANLLVDQIAAARASGTLTGNVSASFIRNIIDKQAAGGAIMTEPGALVPTSILFKALSYVTTNH
jgi:hypothetical protein